MWSQFRLLNSNDRCSSVALSGWSPRRPGDPLDLLWVLMITSAANPRWPEEVEIDDHEGAGLPIASVVRTAKIATIEARAARRLGTISRQNATHVAAILRR